MKMKYLKRFTKLVLWVILIGIINGAIFIGYMRGNLFANVQEMLVTSAMTTLRHQYIADLVASKDKIKEIMEKNLIVNDENSDESAISTIATVDNNPGDARNKEIELTDVSNGKYKGYLLTVPDPSRISIATTNQMGKYGMLLSDMVKDNKATSAINAGGFADAEGKGTGGTPTGLIISNGNMCYGDAVGRTSIIGFNDKNVLVLGNYNSSEIKEKKIRDAVSFGPFLVINGEPQIKNGDGGWGLAPRTAIGQCKDGTVLMLVIDGRQVSSIGATLKEVQDIMIQHGAVNAANLDGGASTTMIYKDRMVNHPSSRYGPRYLPSAFIVK